MATESTPLVDEPAKVEDGGTFYFVKRNPSTLPEDAIAIGGGGVEREEDVINGSTTDRDASKPWWSFGRPASKPNTTMLRKVPVKVEPKVFFSNERTFIAWMHMAVTLATIAIAILAFAEHNAWSTFYGLIILPVAIAFVIYALFQYMKRAAMIRRREPGPYEDTVGPVLLATMLMVAISLNFVVKVYDMYG
ncbi:unnamed protein product [Chrysoparadoxa australica]